MEKSIVDVAAPLVPPFSPMAIGGTDGGKGPRDGVHFASLLPSAMDLPRPGEGSKLVET